MGLPDDFHHFVPAALCFSHGLDYARALEGRSVAINLNSDLPMVVPAECIEYDNPLALSSFCTSATSWATEAVPVPTW